MNEEDLLDEIERFLISSAVFLTLVYLIWIPYFIFTDEMIRSFPSKLNSALVFVPSDLNRRVPFSFYYLWGFHWIFFWVGLRIIMSDETIPRRVGTTSKVVAVISLGLYIGNRINLPLISGFFDLRFIEKFIEKILLSGIRYGSYYSLPLFLVANGILFLQLMEEWEKDRAKELEKQERENRYMEEQRSKLQEKERERMKEEGRREERKRIPIERKTLF